MKTKLFLVKAQNANPAGSLQFDAIMNNYQTHFSTCGDMIMDYSTYTTKTFIPKYSNSSPIFDGAIWLGGYDQNNTLHTAAMTYRQNGFDFWPGPIDTATVLTDSALSASYDKFYPIYKYAG